VSKNTSNGSKQKKSLQRRRNDRQAEELKDPSWLSVSSSSFQERMKNIFWKNMNANWWRNYVRLMQKR
jgi:hypothetical protein